MTQHLKTLRRIDAHTLKTDEHSRPGFSFVRVKEGIRVCAWDAKGDSFTVHLPEGMVRELLTPTL